ncbi:MAG: four helix bundle protein [bacterium]|nr:four helix bundle protein [bacterium]
MTTFQSFEDIKAWQEGRILTRTIRAICKRAAVRRDFAFIDQITRASRSICANIAEGHDTTTNAEFVTFLGYAKRSCAEVQSHLYDALDEKYIEKDELRSLLNQARKICSMLAKLMQYLRNTDLPSRTAAIHK